jgi:hypothetical protein
MTLQTIITKTTKRLTSQHNQVKYISMKNLQIFFELDYSFFFVLTEEKHFIEYEDSEGDVEIPPLIRKPTPVVPDTICFHCNKPVPEGGYHHFVNLSFSKSSQKSTFLLSERFVEFRRGKDNWTNSFS